MERFGLKKVPLLLVFVALLQACSTLPSSATTGSKKNLSKELGSEEKPRFIEIHPPSPLTENVSLIPESPIPGHFLKTPVLDSYTIRIFLPPLPVPASSLVSPPLPPVPPTVSEQPQKKLIPPVPVPAQKSPEPRPESVPAGPVVPAYPPVSQPSVPVPDILPTISPAPGKIKPQDITSRAGDDVFVQFSKNNWLYLDPSSQQQAVGFLESRREKQGTSFLFHPKSPGSWDLTFQRQDLMSGESEIRKVHLTVLPADARITGNAGEATLNDTLGAEPSTEEMSKPLEQIGEVPAAVQKLLEKYNPKDTRANWQIGSLLAKNGQTQEALTYLRKNLGHPSSELLPSLTLATEIASKNPELGLGSLLPSWTTFGFVPSEKVYLEALASLLKADDVPDGLDWADKYPVWYPIPTARDRWLFLKAGLLEKPSAQRDLFKAMKLYQTIVDDYPLSDFWRLAGQRSAALSRQVLDVR
jgi:hypothetical protein